MRNRVNSQIVLPAFLILLLFGIGFGIGMLISKSRGDKYEKFDIAVCATSDVHGAYFDSTYDGKANRTSLANVSSYMKKLRASSKNVVLIDNGDNLQGNDAVYYYNYVMPQKKHVFSKIAEYLKYDAIIVGNHDIETGHPVYDRLSKATKIPYLAANAVVSEGKHAGKPYFKPYTIVKRGKLKIAVIGMTNPNTGSWVCADKMEGMDLLQISDVAQGWIDKIISKEKPHLVILSVHSGTMTPEKEVEPDIENEALYLAQTLEGVDIVICGHDHRPYKTLVDRGGDKTVALLNPGTKAGYVAQCDVQLVLKNRKVAASCFTNQLVDMNDYPADPEYCEHVRPEFEEVKAYANQEIGSLVSDINFEDALKGPSSYMELIHAVQLSESGAEISLSAPLTTKGVLKAGTLTRKDLFELYRFENTLYSIRMTGRQIKDYLEYSYDMWVNDSGISYNYDSAAGIDYTVSLSAPRGERVSITSMSSGEPFDPDKEYLVAINSYRASGGGGHLKDGVGIDPKEIKIEQSFRDVRALIAGYIESNGVVEPKLTGNWRFVQ